MASRFVFSDMDLKTPLPDLSDAELKTTLGQLLEKDSVDEIFHALQNYITDKRVWSILTHHLCMNKIHRPQPVQVERVSYKIAQVVEKFGQEKLRQAFLELLKDLSENFNGPFDALFQKVSAVVDFGCLMEPESVQEDDMLFLAPFIPILNIDGNTSDTHSHRLAMKFAEFLTKLCFKDGPEVLNVNFSNDDLVLKLFENLKMKKDIKGSDVKEESEGRSIEQDELDLLKLKEGPETVKDYTSFWTDREEWKKPFMALSLFPEFAKKHRLAVKAQSEQLVRTLYIIDNKLNIKDFTPMVTQCLVQVIYSDLSAIPHLLDKLDFQKIVSKKVQVITVLHDVMDIIVNHKGDFEESLNPIIPSKPKKRELGKVVRRSMTLDQNKQTTVRPVTCTVRWVLVPFFNKMEKMELNADTEPNFAAAIINFMQKSVEWRPSALLKVVHEYFNLLKRLRLINDWSIRIQCVRVYLALRQFAIDNKVVDEIQPELTDLSDFLKVQSNAAIATSDKNIQIFLTELQQNIQVLSGNLSRE